MERRTLRLGKPYIHTDGQTDELKLAMERKTGRGNKALQGEGGHLKDTSMEIISVNLSAITSFGRLNSVWRKLGGGSGVEV